MDVLVWFSFQLGSWLGGRRVKVLHAYYKGLTCAGNYGPFCCMCLYTKILYR